jgi:uncharacterized protein
MENELTQLNNEEIRVLGALIEKSKTTPDYYPMTLNALVNACNQKSSRNPVVEYDENTVIETLDTLKKKQLIAHVIGASGSRALKYRHTIAIKYPLDPAETSVLCLLFLRGPLTPGEINSNAGRLHEFDSLQEVQETLDNLMQYELPFVKMLAKKAGQKEQRFIHCFSNTTDYEIFLGKETSSSTSSELENRMVVLESEVADLKEKLQKILNEFNL